MGQRDHHPALVIGGMHRSGTSLIASLFASAGVPMGEALMGPERGNERGHFEDLEFYRLHQRALAANGLGTEGYACQGPVEVPPALVAEADELLERRRGLGRIWGWKDPRTVLFLEFWRPRLPEATFLFVFRRPWEVVDSLFRRGDAAFAMNPRLAVDVWIAYNRRIRDFVLEHRERCLLVEASHVVRDPAGLVATVGARLGDALAPPEDRFEPGLFVEDPSLDRARLVRQMRPEAMELYGELRGLAGEPPLPRLLNTAPDITGDLLDAAAMQWVRAARAESLCRTRELEHTKDRAMRAMEAASAAQSLAAIVEQHRIEKQADDALREDLTRRLEATGHEIASLRDRLDAAFLESTSLAEQLAIARRKKTVRERLSIEGRRILRQAGGLLGLAWHPAASGR